ncbi:5-deoxy-glucuronate isomerase [Bacillus cihuensis]
MYTEDRSSDESMTVENGDIVNVPVGYHKHLPNLGDEKGLRI